MAGEKKCDGAILVLFYSTNSYRRSDKSDCPAIFLRLIGGSSATFGDGFERIPYILIFYVFYVGIVQNT